MFVGPRDGECVKRSIAYTKADPGSSIFGAPTTANSPCKAVDTTPFIGNIVLNSVCFHGRSLRRRKTHLSPSHSSEEMNPSEAMVIYLSVIATAVKSSIRSFCEIEVCNVGLRLGKAVGLVVCVGEIEGRINGFVVGIAEGA